MILKLQVLFCDNEHGLGPVCFPDFESLSSHELEQQFIQGNTTRELRRLAKEKGWGRVNGGDYCPGCMESGV